MVDYLTFVRESRSRIHVARMQLYFTVCKDIVRV